MYVEGRTAETKFKIKSNAVYMQVSTNSKLERFIHGVSVIKELHHINHNTVGP